MTKAEFTREVDRVAKETGLDAKTVTARLLEKVGAPSPDREPGMTEPGGFFGEGGGFSQAVEAATPGNVYRKAAPYARELVSTGLNALVPGGLGQRAPEGGIARLAGGMAVPETLPQAAMTYAAPAVGALPSVGGRLAASTLIGAGAGAAGPEGPVQGGLTGAVSGLTGEALGGTARGAQTLAHRYRERVMTNAHTMASFARDARAGAASMIRSVPAFLGAYGPRRGGNLDAQAIHTIKERGQGLISRSLQRVEGEVQRELGPQLLQLPLTRAYANDVTTRTSVSQAQRVTPAGMPAGDPTMVGTRRSSGAGDVRYDPMTGQPRTNTPMSIQEALAWVKEARDDVERAVTDQARRVANAAHRAIRQEILGAVNTANPQLGQRWSQELEFYGTGKALIRALDKSRATIPDVRSSRGSVFDGQKFLDYLEKNPKEAVRLEPIRGALLHGSEPGAADRYLKLPFVRTYLGQGVSFPTMLPPVKTARRGGFTPTPGGEPVGLRSIGQITGAQTIGGLALEP